VGGFWGGAPPPAGLKTQVVRYALERANAALADLRAGRLQGAAVLLPGSL
jgi:propanol-preferring alcohol dehydrogenase